MDVDKKLYEFDKLLEEYCHKPLSIDIIMQALEISEEEFDILWAEYKDKQISEDFANYVKGEML